MATSYGIHGYFKGEFDPTKNRSPWDNIVHFCGENGARIRSRPHACRTHGIDLQEGCGECDNYRNKYQENFRGCGKKWIGGDTCWDCVMKRPGGAEAMIIVMPKVEYLRYNDYKGYIPPEVLRGRDD